MFTHTRMRPTFLAWLVGVMSFFSLSFFISSASAQGITMIFPDLWTQFQTTSFPVWFIGGGNNYAGLIIITAIDVLPVPQEVTFNNNTYQFNCKRQIKWWYFNTARGIGLVPLQTGWPVGVVGWLYTQCENKDIKLPSSIAPNHIIGYIAYSLWWAPLGAVVFGNTITSSEITANSYNPNYNNSANGSVQWLNIWWNELQLFGAFFDTMLGIGIIDGWGTGNATDLIGTFNKIRIQWFAWLGSSVDWSERQILSSTLAGTKTLLNTSQEINNATVINTVSKNAAQLCRGSISNNNNVKCENSSITIDGNYINANLGKDIVVNGNVFIDKSAYSVLAEKSISLFVRNGNLIFDNTIDSSFLRRVDDNGFRVSSGTGITQGIYLQGNFIVDGLILWGTSLIDYNTSIPFRTYIHGRIASLNTFTNVSSKRQSYLVSKLWSTWSELWWSGSVIGQPNTTFPSSTWSPSMEEIFSFVCTDDGSWFILSGFTDTDTITAVQSISCPLGHVYPLMVVEKNIPTLLLR